MHHPYGNTLLPEGALWYVPRMDNPASSNPPQFSTAEYTGVAGAARCPMCQQIISGSYYRVNKGVACVSCANRLSLERPRDSHAAFTRGLLFGAGGAILGLILYAAFGIITGWMIGYVSLAVGYIVAKAVMMGSGGVGGRRYQMAAVILTYAAVSMAAVPIAIGQYSKAHHPTRSVQTVNAPGSEAPASVPEGQAPTVPSQRSHSVGLAFGMLALIGLASPFLELQDPVHGLIGLVILFVGLRIAWRIAAGNALQIQGPFKVATAVMPKAG